MHFQHELTLFHRTVMITQMTLKARLCSLYEDTVVRYRTSLEEVDFEKK